MTVAAAMFRPANALLLLLVGCIAAAPSLLREAAAQADAATPGHETYNQCIGCHSPERNRTGPLHCGLFGRTAGTVPGFEYSPAMRDSQITWDATTLDWFLRSPLEAIPGTTMGFAGIKDDARRARLITWLETLAMDSPQCADVR